MRTPLATAAPRPVQSHGLVRVPYAIRASLFAAALVAAGTADVSEDAARWGGMRGPVCLVGQCLGPHACPGCGLVRSVASAVQGDFAQSLAFHPGGFAVVLALAASFAWDLAALASLSAPRRDRRFPAVLLQVTVAIVLTGWIVRLLAPASFLPIAP